jgi:peptidoglycan hydrolase-like protein with peptidoglycan-binding domain
MINIFINKIIKINLSKSAAIFLLSMLTISPAVTLAQYSPGTINAANTSYADIKCPEYNFTRTLSQGDSGSDVKLIQKILNLDYRTRISVSGIGSPGSETLVYGVATREAVKKFQALFIELIGVADGKINSRTMTVLNSVCKGPYFTGGSGSVFDINKPATTSAKDVLAPSVTISAPANVYSGETYRMWIYASEAIKEPSLSSFITSGGAGLSDMRKENPSTYKVLVTPNKTATYTIVMQMEAESVRDLAGNVSINASNEISTVITPAPVGPDLTRPSVSLLNTSLLSVGTYGTNAPVSVTVSFSEPVLATPTLSLSNFIVTGPITLSNLKRVDERLYSVTVTTSAIDKSVATLRLPADLVSDSSGNKNNASGELTLVIYKPENPNPAPEVVANPDYGGGESGGGLGELMQMLGQFGQALGGLLGSGALSGGGAGAGGAAGEAAGGAGSGGLDFGGISDKSGECACGRKTFGNYPGQITYLVSARGAGPSGGYLSPLAPLIGCSIGKYKPFVGICGLREECKKGKCTCIGPTLDSKGIAMKAITLSNTKGAGGACGAGR